MDSPKIFVLGSANMDLVLPVERLPREGETLSGGDLALFPGGKGANQACAAAKLGGTVLMIAQVGDDPFGSRLVRSLEEAGADVSRVGVTSRPTGCACIYVLPTGENSIVISPGANATLDPATALERLSDISADDLLLLQLEIPLETVEAALAFAAMRGARTILDPAPARPLPSGMLANVSLLTPNQTEAATILGAPDREIGGLEEAEQAARALLGCGVRSVAMKLGAAGCLWADRSLRHHAAPPRVTAIDTTAAGDVFNGAIAVALAEGLAVPAAVRFANAAAAISVTRMGAQSSIPDKEEVAALARYTKQ